MRFGKKMSKKQWVTILLTAFFLIVLSLNLLLGKTLQSQPASQGMSMTGQFLKLIFAVGIIVVLIYASLWFLNKFVYHRKNLTGQQRVEVVGTTPLGPKKFIYLVKVFDRLLVLGVTDNQISNLTEITDAEVLNQLKAEGTKGPAAGGKRPFQTQLEGLLKRS